MLQAFPTPYYTTFVGFCRFWLGSLDICPDVVLTLSNKRASSVQKLRQKFFYPLNCADVASAERVKLFEAFASHVSNLA